MSEKKKVVGYRYIWGGGFDTKEGFYNIEIPMPIKRTRNEAMSDGEAAFRFMQINNEIFIVRFTGESWEKDPDSDAIITHLTEHPENSMAYDEFRSEGGQIHGKEKGTFTDLLKGEFERRENHMVYIDGEYYRIDKVFEDGSSVKATDEA